MPEHANNRLKPFLFLLLIFAVVISGYIVWEMFNSLYYERVSKKTSPTGRSTLSEIRSKDERGHAPYGVHLVLAPGEVDTLNGGVVIFAGYCDNFAYEWSSETSIDIDCRGPDAKNIRTLVRIIKGIEVSLRPHCSTEDSTAFLSTSNEISSWNDYFEFYRKYRQCDDGAVAEGFSVQLGKLLSRGHPQLDVASTLVANDPGFETFFYRHINTTTDWDDLRQALGNSQERCPPNHQEFCVKLESAISEVLEEVGALSPNTNSSGRQP